MQLASGMLPIYSRTPTLTAMTAAGLDAVSRGRFVLGLGKALKLINHPVRPRIPTRRVNVVSLQHALLATLLDGDATGYELAKRFDIAASNIWHAQRAQ